MRSWSSAAAGKRRLVSVAPRADKATQTLRPSAAFRLRVTRARRCIAPTNRESVESSTVVSSARLVMYCGPLWCSTARTRHIEMVSASSASTSPNDSLTAKPTRLMRYGRYSFRSSMDVLGTPRRRDFRHEAVHLLFHQRVRLAAVVEIQDHFAHARRFDAAEIVDDLLRRPDEHRLVREVFRAHVAENLDDLQEIAQRRRHRRGVRGKRRDERIFE